MNFLRLLVDFEEKLSVHSLHALIRLNLPLIRFDYLILSPTRTNSLFDFANLLLLTIKPLLLKYLAAPLRLGLVRQVSLCQSSLGNLSLTDYLRIFSLLSQYLTFDFQKQESEKLLSFL